MVKHLLETKIVRAETETITAERQEVLRVNPHQNPAAFMPTSNPNSIFQTPTRILIQKENKWKIHFLFYFFNTEMT